MVSFKSGNMEKTQFFKLPTKLTSQESSDDCTENTENNHVQEMKKKPVLRWKH